MPVKDGVQATRDIMAKTPCAILVVTANVTTNADKVYQAMGFGALDAVNTPNIQGGFQSEGALALLRKIETISHLVQGFGRSRPPEPPKPFFERGSFQKPMIGIGASTGGPNALLEILSKLPANLGASIVIVQHIDEVFADGLVNWLKDHCALKVRVAVAGKHPALGIVDVAATNDHLVLTPEGTFAYTTQPLDSVYRPSVDAFFNSMAENVAGTMAGVLLTGMGADGAQGLLRLRQKGAYTIAQDEKSCVVFGMPKAAIQMKAAMEVLSPREIVTTLVNKFPARKEIH
jgi:two-component system response regulator WspF